MGEAPNNYGPAQGMGNQGWGGAGYQQYGQQQYQQQPPQYGYQQQPQPPPPSHPPPQNHPPPAAPSGPAPPYNPGGELGEKPSFDQAFKISKPKYNDLWAGILFLLVVGGFIAISALAIYGYTRTRSVNGSGIYNRPDAFSLDSNTIFLFLFVLAVAFVFSFGYVWLARLFPKQFIWITGILNICWAVGTAVFYLWRRYWGAGILFLVFALFLMFAFYTWISRIPFSALMLKTSIDVSKKYGHVYLVSFIGGAIAAAFGAWYSITLVAIHSRYQPSADNPNCGAGGAGCSQGKVIGLIIYITFAMYWISEWLKNTIHTIISGVYGSWYFCVNNFPKGATCGAAKRALTYSFGSISLGSLLVAIIQLLRQLCSIARQNAMNDGGIAGIIGYVIFCIVGCLISLLEWAVQFLNRYAFSHIALYGKAYIPAAKDTWKMIKDRGFDALINDCLIGPVLSFGAIFIGYACTLLAYLYLFFTDPPYNSDGKYTPVILAFSFLIGFQMANVFTTPISSGIDTIFVAAGWDPQIMWRDHPEVYAEMVKVYPKVQAVIRDR